MTITTNPSRDEYTSSPGQTVFNYTFKIYESTDLNVYVTPEGQEANDATDIVTNYTVDSNTISNDAGGFITFDSPLNDGDLVTIVSDIPTDRTTDYQANGDFIPQTVNNDFDRTVSLVKQVENLATRTIQFQESQQSATGITLPAPNPGDILQWNDAGDGFENTDGSGILGIDQAVADAESARDAAQQSEANAANSETDSSDSALLSQAWAESATEPGDPGTKSSKTWAGESAASAQEAADEVASIDKVYLKSGRKNYIINGDFSINQRAFGGGQPSAGVYGYDRWKGDAAGTRIEQVVENSDSINDSFVISWLGGTGTATIDGVTGLNSGDTFTLNTSSDFSVIIPTDATKIQLEKGSYATDFEYRPIAEELALCQRYYINSASNDSIRYRYKTPSATANIALGSTAFPVTMRTSLPTITLENESTINASAVRLRARTDKNIIVEWDELSTTSTITVNCGYTADAEL